MTVTSVNSTTHTAAATQGAGTASGLTSAADQQDRFMKLLVAQMQNQDPLNPMDNAQMTTQIAQINTVAGIEKLNTTVQGMASEFAAMREMLLTRLPAGTDAAGGTTSSN
jgi:flagellar basal-body rod modification protein FlgD